jgi:hypothetical protein
MKVRDFSTKNYRALEIFTNFRIIFILKKVRKIIYKRNMGLNI